VLGNDHELARQYYASDYEQTRRRLHCDRQGLCLGAWKTSRDSCCCRCWCVRRDQVARPRTDFICLFRPAHQDDITAWSGGVQRQFVNTDLANLFRGGASQQQAQRKKTTANSNRKQQPQATTLNNEQQQRTPTTTDNNKQHRQTTTTNNKNTQQEHTTPTDNNNNFFIQTTQQQTTNRSTQPHTTHNPNFVVWLAAWYVRRSVQYMHESKSSVHAANVNVHRQPYLAFHVLSTVLYVHVYIL